MGPWGLAPPTPAGGDQRWPGHWAQVQLGGLSSCLGGGSRAIFVLGWGGTLRASLGSKQPLSSWSGSWAWPGHGAEPSTPAVCSSGPVVARLGTLLPCNPIYGGILGTGVWGDAGEGWWAGLPRELQRGAGWGFALHLMLCSFRAVGTWGEEGILACRPLDGGVVVPTPVLWPFSTVWAALLSGSWGC